MKLDLTGIYMDKRDIDLLSYLFAVKVATYEQIHRDIYPNISLGSASNRIRRLEDNRLIEIGRNRLVLHGKRTVSIRKRGFDGFIKKGDEKRSEFRSDAINHDLVLGDVRFRMRSSPRVVGYKTENEIQTWGGPERKINSDAIATISLPTRNIEVPLEYERTQKSDDQYEKKAKQYYQDANYPLVFFVAETQGVLTTLQEIEKKLYNWDKPKFFYSLQREFLTDDALVLRNCNNSTFNLSQPATYA